MFTPDQYPSKCKTLNLYYKYQKAYIAHIVNAISVQWKLKNKIKYWTETVKHLKRNGDRSVTLVNFECTPTEPGMVPVGSNLLLLSSSLGLGLLEAIWKHSAGFQYLPWSFALLQARLKLYIIKNNATGPRHLTSTCRLQTYMLHWN